jgi:hypothetical protein
MLFKTKESREATQECLKMHKRDNVVPTKHGNRPYCNEFLYWWAGWTRHTLYGRPERTTGGLVGRKSKADIDVMVWFELLKDSVEQMPDERHCGRNTPIYQV